MRSGVTVDKYEYFLKKRYVVDGLGGFFLSDSNRLMLHYTEIMQWARVAG